MRELAVLQRLDAQTLEVVLRLLMCWSPVQHDAEIVEVVAGFVQEHVPAAHGLDERIVLELLHAAVKNFRFADGIVWQLCRLPAAERLTRSAVEQLVHDATERGAHGCGIQSLQGLLASLGNAS
jgi:hypothetical protein